MRATNARCAEPRDARFPAQKAALCPDRALARRRVGRHDADAARAARHENLALDLDGSFFAETSCDDDGVARFEFAFPPNGRAGIDAMPRATRDGAKLAATPLRLLPGQSAADVAAPRATSPRWIAAGARPMPFGTDAAAPDVAIVVPVFNAPELVARCLDSLLAHTFGKAQLIVIDDASDDPAIAPLLARYAHRLRVRVLRNEVNRGFTATANRGIAAAGHADVVLLNADTQVGPNWLQGLRRAAYSDALVATATAVSDNAGAFSVPELERENAQPASWSFDDTRARSGSKRDFRIRNCRPATASACTSAAASST
jgi:hypothetical protein